MSNHEKDPLEMVQDLFGFLQGKIQPNIRISEQATPRLTPEQAWSVIWYLGNLYQAVPDYIERCDVCGNLYNSWQEGETMDHPPGPAYMFCEECRHTDQAKRKRRIGRRLELEAIKRRKARKIGL